MTKSTPTLSLTQSGLLAVLLQRQRYRVFQLTRRRAHRKQMLPPFGVPSLGRSVRSRHERSSTIPPGPWWEPSRATLESFTKPIIRYHQIHTYSELKQQIHDDLRIQHPEWVQPNGESPTCDSYESRLTEMLDALTRTGSNATRSK